MDLNIVIIGAGEVGYNLAKSLSKGSFDITIIDIDVEKCKKVKQSIDARVINGDGVSQRILQQIDMSNIDYLLALTRIDEVNLVSSKIAYEMGAKKIICRLRNTEYSHRDAIVTPEQFGIDKVVYPERAAQSEIEHLIRQTSAIEIKKFKHDRITMVGVKIEASSPLIGRSVENVETSNPYIPHKLALIIRGDFSFIPNGDTIYKASDLAYYVSETKNIESIQQMAGKPSFKVQNILILGAGKIGRLLAKRLESEYNVKIIEKNSEKAKQVSSNLSDALILDADGLNTDFLESENIEDIDCFIAATENEQTNIVASLLVKHYNIKQVIIHISTTSYIQAIRRIGVDAVVCKNISVVNEVLNIIRSDQDEIPISCFEEIDVDAVEVKVSQDSKYIKKRYSIDKIPQSIRLVSIIRENKIFTPNRYSEILPNDEVLIFTKEDMVEKAELLFK